MTSESEALVKELARLTRRVTVLEGTLLTALDELGRYVRFAAGGGSRGEVAAASAMTGLVKLRNALGQSMSDSRNDEPPGE